MTVYGINSTSNDRETTWADVKPTIHPQTLLKAMSLSLYKLASKLADEAEPEWTLIDKMNTLAAEFDRMDREGWKDEVTAQEADHQDDMTSQRP